MQSLLLALLLAARPFTPEELLATRRVDDVQVSPDGKWASVTVRQKNLETNKDDKDIWLLPVAGGQARQFTRNARSEHARWSPDSKQLLIVREDQLWLYELSGGDAHQITKLSGGAQSGVFSPDGRWIAFSSEVYPQCGGNDACNKERAERAEKSGVRARIVDHLFARHWSEWKEGKRTHVFVMPASGGPARDVTPFDSNWPSIRVGGGDDFRFTPEGELIVSSKPAQREAWSTNGDLWSIDRSGGAPKNLTPDNHGDDAQPRPSPDGRYLAWTSQARDGYESDTWRLKIQDRKSGRITAVDIDTDDVGSFAWGRDSKGIVASVAQKARHWLYAVSLDGKYRRFTEAPVNGGDFDVAPDGTAVVAASGILRPPEAFTVKPGGQPARLSRFNDEQYRDLNLGTLEELWTDSGDGSKVHSWVVRPANPPAKLPLIVLIHGGPQGSWEDAWSMRWNAAAFAARGYVVVTPDFHGSTGYGQKFKEQISGDWGGVAYEDVMRATDAAEKLPFVETGRTCAAGASFGGYMVDWIAGHTDRFKCLVSHDGVFDLVSEYGSTEELWFPEWEFRGPPWENPELYRRLSPSSYVQNFKTPTLVIQGELDFRVPVEQGLGMFTALQRRGIESRLLYFPDEGHWVLKPKNSQLWYHTVLDWIDAHARPGNRRASRP
jgi:dipeptidyl aminopeptidase/acylaminoacyl peptidase